MDARLVYKTDDSTKVLLDDTLTHLDMMTSSGFRNEEKLRKSYSDDIGLEDGEFKILVNPQYIPLDEVKYYDIESINKPIELDVRYDSSRIGDFINNISIAMNSSDYLLNEIYKRYNEYLSSQEKMTFLIGRIQNNIDLQLSSIGWFIRERLFDDKERYLFAREFDTYCKRIIEEEKSKKNKYFML